MLYAVGTHIPLRPENTKTQTVEKPEKPAKAPGQFSYDAGTQFVFKWVGDRMVATRKINVAFA
jgi:hypothetical protein